MALYRKSRTYRAFDSENGCFFDQNYEFSCEISEKNNKKIKKSEKTFGAKYTIIFGVGVLLTLILATFLPYYTNMSINIMFLIASAPLIFCVSVLPIAEYCHSECLYDKYVRPLENMFETMYNEICAEEHIKAETWLKQHQDEPMTAHIQQVLEELNRG